MLGVICLHVNTKRLDEPVAFIMSRICGISIPLFFMVSGYLMDSKDTTFKYVIHKIVGIVRFVFLVTLIYIVMFVIWNRKFELGLLLILPKSFFQRGPLWVFWYFGAMCMIYIAIPFFKKLDSTTRYFPERSLLVLMCVNFLVFILTLVNHFEFLVPQTFRIWNWTAYFLIGILISRYRLKISSVSFEKAIPLLMIAFVTFVYYMKPYIGKIEHFFTTPLCACYALSVFISVLNIKIDNKFIGNVSVFFLPVYVLHVFVIYAYRNMANTANLGAFSPVFDYIIVSLLSLVASYLVMKVAFIRNIFKI